MQIFQILILFLIFIIYFIIYLLLHFYIEYISIYYEYMFLSCWFEHIFINLDFFCFLRICLYICFKSSPFSLFFILNYLVNVYIKTYVHPVNQSFFFWIFYILSFLFCLYSFPNFWLWVLKIIYILLDIIFK